MYHEDGSRVNLDITNPDNPVKANLTYAYAEKDKNTGTFEGAFNDGKLIGTYTFQSEGVESKQPRGKPTRHLKVKTFLFQGKPRSIQISIIE